MDEQVVLTNEEAQRLARQAAHAGVLSMALVIFTPCYCYLLCFLALPMGIYSLYLTGQVSEYVEDPAVKAYRETAMLCGALGTMMSAAWVVVVLLYFFFFLMVVVIYGVVFVMYVLAMILAIALSV